MQYKNIKVGDIVYLRCNSDVIPKGYMKLVVREENGRLIGQEDGDYQRYDIVAWYNSLEFSEPK